MTAHISADGTGREESVAEHTERTTFLCSEKGKRCGLAHVMSLCGIFHDMGKNKQKFYDYIHADERARKRLHGTIAHASTGAKYCYDRYHDSSGNMKLMAEMISYAVAAHHGLFDCVDAGHTDLFSKKTGEVEDYDEACRNAVRDYLDVSETDNVSARASDEFNVVLDKIKEVLAKVKPFILSGDRKNAKIKLTECKFFMLSCLQRLILSILIDSDWEATSDFMNDVDTRSKQTVFSAEEIFRQAGENFQAYMNKKQESVTACRTEKERAIFDARNILQKECRQFAEYPAGIYCLPIPTGGGKTLSSLAYALEYCRRHHKTGRIIYVSPYISITEQNAQVFRDAVGNAEWILEHHSSVVRSRDEEDGDDHSQNLSMYDINWEEPFICTTFVQFMNTLFSDKRASVRRMHRLVNSVVIIDEVQSMPLKCVHTFNYMMNFLNGVCGTDIILCTATQPALGDAQCPICYSQPEYMIGNAQSWFRKFERVKINTPKIGQKYTMDSLGDEIAAQTRRYRSILLVLNTKSAVRGVYDRLKERDVNVEYLTTNLCAEHRSDKIRSIREALSKKKNPIVVVSTSLIEAGVDISFECVYRSMTGLDSLAQTAGRCNRNGEMDCGTINLIDLAGENTGNMSELKQNIRVAENLIDQYNDSEKEDSLLMPVWMDRYYQQVYSGASEKMNFPVERQGTNIVELLSRGFVPEERRNLMNQAYRTAGQAYRVIDDDSFGVIVPYRKGAKIIASIQETSDPAELKEQIRQAQRYTVNVRGSQLKKLEGLIQPVSGNRTDLYMVAAPGAYSLECGITPEWETLII